MYKLAVARHGGRPPPLVSLQWPMSPAHLKGKMWHGVQKMKWQRGAGRGRGKGLKSKLKRAGRGGRGDGHHGMVMTRRVHDDGRLISHR